MTSEQKQAKLEVLNEAITRMCSICKEEASSVKKTLGGSGEKLHHTRPGKEIVVCKAGLLHLMVFEINQQETD